MLPRPTAWPTLLAGFGAAFPVAFLVDRGWLAATAGFAVVGAGSIAAQTIASKTRYRLTYAISAALAVAVAVGWFAGLWLQSRLAGAPFSTWLQQTSRGGVAMRLCFLVLLLFAPGLALVAKRQSHCEKCGRLRDQRWNAAMPLTRSKLIGFEKLDAALEAAADARLKQIYSRGVEQDLTAKKVDLAADRFIQVLLCRCDSCGSAELRTQWMRKGRRSIELVREEVRPL